MKNIIFESLVKNNNIIIKVNRRNEKLVTKEQFIDDMLTTERVDNIYEYLVDINEVKAEYNTEWSVIRFYCHAIMGLREAIFVEHTVGTLVGTRTTDFDSIKQMEEMKIKYISDFANYLFK